MVSHLRSLRSSVWLLVDLLDDLLELTDDLERIAALMELRNGAVELLFQVRMLEKAVDEAVRPTSS